MSNRLRRGDWRVTDVPIASARRLVQAHHYAKGASNSATFLHGLVAADDPHDLRAVAWWIPPTKDAAAANYEGDWKKVLVLSRLVCTPDAPRNSPSFLLAQSVKAIRRDGRFECLLTYADEWQGHTGAIYRASNWEYLGLTAGEGTFVDAEGRMISRKRGNKTRTKQEMLDLGYEYVGRHRRHRFRLKIKPMRQSERAQPFLFSP